MKQERNDKLCYIHTTEYNADITSYVCREFLVAQECACVIILSEKQDEKFIYNELS